MCGSAILREPYVDRSRIGAFGKDYGGYITSLLVSNKESPVKCAAVLSPITDFELYGELPLSLPLSLSFVTQGCVEH